MRSARLADRSKPIADPPTDKEKRTKGEQKQNEWKLFESNA